MSLLMGCADIGNIGIAYIYDAHALMKRNLVLTGMYAALINISNYKFTTQILASSLPTVTFRFKYTSTIGRLFGYGFL